MAFDPDAYLAEKQGGFDPDAYLAGRPTEAPVVEAVPEMPVEPAEPGFRDRLQSIISGMPRAAGLAARSTIEGLGGALEFVGTPLKVGIEQVTGKPVGLAETAISGLEQAGLPLPEPETPTERVIGTAEELMAGGGGFAGVSGKAAQLMKMGVPQKIVQAMAARPELQLSSALGAGMTGGLAKEAGLDPVAQAGLTLAGGLLAPGGVSGLRKGKEATKAFMKAHKLGYRIPPALAKPTKPQQFIEGAVAGSAATRQKASVYNQKVTNDLIKKDIGYPDDLPLSREGLDTVRAGAGKVYEQAKRVGIFKTDAAFLKDLRKIAGQGSAVVKEFPEMMKKDIIKLAKTFNKKEISSEALVDVVKQLRADASVGFRSQDPSTLALAKANGKMANALEALMERSIKKSNPDLLPALKASRQRIAKTYTIEKALKGENIDARTLGRELDKGKPLSGLMKDVAEFGQKFKGAAMTDVPQTTNFRVTDLLTGMGGAAIMGDPKYLAMVAARPTVRATLLSKPYQAMLAKIRPTEMQRISQLPKEVRAVEMLGLLREIKDEETSGQDNLPQ